MDGVDRGQVAVVGTIADNVARARAADAPVLEIVAGVDTVAAGNPAKDSLAGLLWARDDGCAAAAARKEGKSGGRGKGARGAVEVRSMPPSPCRQGSRVDGNPIRYGRSRHSGRLGDGPRLGDASIN